MILIMGRQGVSGPRAAGVAPPAVVVMAAVVMAAALGLGGCHRAQTDSAPPNGERLKVEMGKAAKLDPDAALRCFVHGQFVGMQTPPQCAQKNGVAPGALDVGLDQSGALAAGAGDTPLQPLSKAEPDNAVGDDNGVDDTDSNDDQAASSPQAAAGPRPTQGRLGDCLRFGRVGWRDVGQGVGLGVCVRTLFNAQCVAPGQAVYGRWGAQTLRLVPGRVEMSDDNRDFHPLAAQNLQDCTVGPL